MEGVFILEKFPGKGGWTYAALPTLSNQAGTPFGWLRVKGSIDGEAIAAYHLMPMGNGHLFLPVKAAVRKKIGKHVGDTVAIVLYKDDVPPTLPGYLQECLVEENLLPAFQALPLGEEGRWIKTITAIKDPDKQALAIRKLLDMLQGTDHGKGKENSLGAKQ